MITGLCRKSGLVEGDTSPKRKRGPLTFVLPSLALWAIMRFSDKAKSKETGGQARATDPHGVAVACRGAGGAGRHALVGRDFHGSRGEPRRGLRQVLHPQPAGGTAGQERRSRHGEQPTRLRDRLRAEAQGNLSLVHGGVPQRSLVDQDPLGPLGQPRRQGVEAARHAVRVERQLRRERRPRRPCLPRCRSTTKKTAAGTSSIPPRAASPTRPPSGSTITTCGFGGRCPKTPGREGFGGPYEDIGVVLQPGKASDKWEGLQGVDSFFPYRVGGRWYAFYGSAHTELRPMSWLVGLATAPELAGPWRRLPELSPVVLDKDTTWKTRSCCGCGAGVSSPCTTRSCRICHWLYRVRRRRALVAGELHRHGADAEAMGRLAAHAAGVDRGARRQLHLLLHGFRHESLWRLRLPGRILAEADGEAPLPRQRTSLLRAGPINRLGTVPIFVRRKWDCPLRKYDSCCFLGPY